MFLAYGAKCRGAFIGAVESRDGNGAAGVLYTAGYGCWMKDYLRGDAVVMISGVFMLADLTVFVCGFAMMMMPIADRYGDKTIQQQQAYC